MINEQQLSNKLRFEEVFHIVKGLDKNASQNGEELEKAKLLLGM